MDSPSPRPSRLPGWWPPRGAWTVVWGALFVGFFVATVGAWLLYSTDNPTQLGTSYDSMTEMLALGNRLSGATVFFALVLAVHEFLAKNPKERQRWTQLWTVVFGILFLIAFLMWATVGVRYGLDKAKDGKPSTPEFVRVAIGYSAVSVFMIVVLRLREFGDDRAFRATNRGRSRI